jgi:hypothetical protein
LESMYSLLHSILISGSCFRSLWLNSNLRLSSMTILV